MVDEDIGLMYDQILQYLEAKQAYYADAETPDVEYSDSKEIDLTSVIDIIQRQIRKRPNLGEAATIRGYRNMRSADSEYDIRLMDRSDYWADAAEEEQDNINKWQYNKKLTAIIMSGKSEVPNGQ